MLELGGEEDPEVECLGALLLELDDEGKQDEVDELKQDDEVENESCDEDEEQQSISLGKLALGVGARL